MQSPRQRMNLKSLLKRLVQDEGDIYKIALASVLILSIGWKFAVSGIGREI